jgi:peptidoglycan/xylan/chitin deacetylase (PgdA/CDA1 family)
MNAPQPQRPIPILLYHSISDDASSQYLQYAVTPADFRAQMELIAERGYRTLTVSELVGLLAVPAAGLPERSVLVTFDDGFAEVYEQGLPVLRNLGITATVFAISGFVGSSSRWLERKGEGSRRLLSWEQLAELRAQGFEVGSHGHSHRQLDTMSKVAAFDELRRSKAILEDHLGASVDAFAYPHGYHSPVLRELVRASGYLAACGVKHALSHPDDDRWALGRAVVSRETSLEELGEWLDGRGLPISRTGERTQTRVWRIVRRTMARVRQKGVVATPSTVA